MPDDFSDLPLFGGDHVPGVRFRNALDRLDLGASVADAPEEWREAVAAMAGALGGASPGRADLQGILAARRDGWPAEIERTWQRLVGRCLDGRGIPGVHGDEIAAAFLLRGGEARRAERSARRHLDHHPGDPRAWEVLAHFDPVRAAVRCAFHGGPVPDAADPVVDVVEADEVEPVARWLLPYGWITGDLGLDDLEQALAAEGLLAGVPLPIPGDAAAFAWHLLRARGRRLPTVERAAPVIDARRAMKRICEPAFRRCLARLGVR